MTLLASIIAAYGAGPILALAADAAAYLLIIRISFPAYSPSTQKNRHFADAAFSRIGTSFSAGHFFDSAHPSHIGTQGARSFIGQWTTSRRSHHQCEMTQRRHFQSAPNMPMPPDHRISPGRLGEVAHEDNGSRFRHHEVKISAACMRLVTTAAAVP